MSLYELLILFPIQLFFVLTPIAAIAALISMTTACTSAQRVKISVQAATIACGIIIVFAAAGPLFFKIFKFSTHSFSIAGGIYLCLIGIGLALPRPGEGEGAENTSATSTGSNIAITPLAMPLLTGPGTISYIFLMRSKVEGSLQVALFFLGIAIAFSAVALCFVLAAKASDALPRLVVKLGEKLTGVMIICIGAQVLISGVRSVLGF